MRIQLPLLSLIIPVTLLASWEITARTGLLDSDTFSQPSHIVVAAWTALLDGSLFTATKQTLECAAAGLAIGALAGTIIGIVLGSRPMAETVSRPTVEILRAIPAVALTPVTLLVFGFGLPMEAAIVAYACAWPMLIAALAATRNIERRLIEVGALLEMRPARLLVSIIAPAVLSRIGVGLSTAMGFALVVAVTVEILVNPRGIGYAMIVAQESFRPALMYAYIVWLAVISIIVGGLASRMGRLSRRAGA